MKKVFIRLFMLALLAAPVVSCSDDDPKQEQGGGNQGDNNGDNTGDDNGDNNGDNTGDNEGEVTYNLFDSADVDEDGWLWLDTQEKIDKYVGDLNSDKLIKLVPAQYEIDDPDFPGETTTPEPYADATLKGYNTLGEQGGEGALTGGIFLPKALFNPEEDWYPTDGGGILVEMPDCAIFELYVSQSLPDVYFEIYAAREETSDPSLCEYVTDDNPTYIYATDEYEGGPVITDYAGPYLNMQDLKYDLNFGEGTPDYLTIYGEKGQPRTAYIAAYGDDSEEDGQPCCDMYIQGIRVLTYTNVNGN